jgi:hypothetical protein
MLCSKNNRKFEKPKDACNVNHFASISFRRIICLIQLKYQN